MIFLFYIFFTLIELIHAQYHIYQVNGFEFFLLWMHYLIRLFL